MSADAASSRADVQAGFSISVKELVEFVWRRGGLGSDAGFVNPVRALEGAKGHRSLQASRPDSYKAEVPLSIAVSGDRASLTIQGRIDGVLPGEPPLLEEIKTVYSDWDLTASDLHWAQVRIYGWIFAEQNNLESVALQLTYLNLDDGQQTVFRESFTAEDLESYFNETARFYLGWLERLVEWRRARDASLVELSFPFAGYREGQRDLSVRVYAAIRDGSRLFAEAPTGIGKTMATLFPTLKAFGTGLVDQACYLTARNTGALAAREALRILRERGARIRSLTLIGREKICFAEDGACDLIECPFAIGFHDRLHAALSALLEIEDMNFESVRRIGEEHSVCPHALAFAAVPWVDVVICDYNYVFSRLTFDERLNLATTKRTVLLVDEAHNLVDRAREIFSVSLASEELTSAVEALKTQAPEVAASIAKLVDGIGRVNATSRFVSDGGDWKRVQGLVQDVLQTAGACLGCGGAAGEEALLETYFACSRFASIGKDAGEEYFWIGEGTGRSKRVKLFCINPARFIGETLGSFGTAVFFSATLRPLDYFEELLGAGDGSHSSVRYASPFPPENFDVRINTRVSVRYQDRERTLEAVNEAIREIVVNHPGNHLIFFPSYDYLEAAFELARRTFKAGVVDRQERGMSEAERIAFLESFSGERGKLRLRFAVMGGLFGEGIDLVGDRLVGAVVVGVGLPQICTERDLIRDYFQERNGRGFDYAYRIPGMIRVLQAAGRVIRTETDRGTALLIDSRYREPAYRDLLPEWWQPSWL